MKKIFVRGFSVTAFSFLMMWGVSVITDLKAFSAFDPISQALGEFQLTDYVFSKFRDDPSPDSRIVLVNLGPTRREIAQQIALINQYKPKVIGIDSYFNCEGGFYDTTNCPMLLDTLGNLMLSSAIQESGKVVLVSRLLQTDSLFKTDSGNVFDSMEYSDPIFVDYAQTGFANLPTGTEDGGAATYQEDVKICRSIIPKMMVNGKEHLAFSIRMAMLYDSVKTKKFLARDNFEEVINFKGNVNISDVRVKTLRDQMTSVSDYNALCFAIDYEQLMTGQFEPSVFENSVVIIGYLGDYFGDPAWEDKFFTPLNTKVAGRANPDMFGPVIHANVVAMILNEEYINEIPLWTQIAIAIVMCFLNVILFFWIDTKFPLLFDGLSVVLQIIEIVIVSLIIVYVFAGYNYKLDLTLTIAVLAAIGPCFDIYKSFENIILEKLTRRRKQVLTT
jgi:CHASE2 domain-containing sensor protein